MFGARVKHVLSLLVTLFLFIQLFLTINPAFASGLGDSLDSYGSKGEDGKVDIGETLKKSRSEAIEGTLDRNKFGYVVHRVFTPNYINQTPKAYAPSGFQFKEKNCDLNDKNAGTPLYHNCDVPNFVGEMAQDIISVFISNKGFVNAPVQNSATLWFPSFGLPNEIPEGGAPVDPNQRNRKYTGLEVIGYSLELTRYTGEWDKINVMSEPRAMSNFGTLDSIGAGVNNFFSSISEAYNSGTSHTSKATDSKVLNAIYGVFTFDASKAFEGGSSNAINTVLDSSDLNVFNTYGWYRDGYGETLYGARELSDQEVAQNALKSYILEIKKYSPKKASIPLDLLSIKSGIKELPKKAKGVCIYEEMVDGKTKTIKTEMSEESCKSYYKSIEKEFKEGSYDPSGAGKAETLEEWLERNKESIKIAEKYGISCQSTEEYEDEDSVQNEAERINSCIVNSWEEASKKALDREKKEATEDYLKNVLDKENLAQAFSANQDKNFNAPWNRFVCVDKNGEDIIDDNGLPVKAFNKEGVLNKKCINEIRPPIQDGWYGNGYVGEKPGYDTRYISKGEALERLVNGFFNPFYVGEVGMGVTAFFTRVSNGFIGLGFSPIMSSLGLDKVVVSAVEMLRDSIFYPIILIAIAFSSIYILWTSRKGVTLQQFKTLFSVAIVAIAGVATLEKPAEVFSIYDKAPSMVESFLLETALNPSSESGLCSVDVKENGKDLSYESINGSMRELQCEVWRTLYFEPYIKMQWGTDYKNLYSAEAKGVPSDGKRFTNTNGKMVGDAGVYLGGGHTEYNWGLYQADIMKYGTPSFYGTSKYGAQIPRELYKVIDAQAGPNNGEGRHTDYFENWRGSHSRNLSGIFYSISSILSAFAIISYSLAKIQISFIMTMMFIILPFMFLAGIVPGKGRSKLKSYLMSLLSLGIQRAVLTTVLVVMLKILLAVTSASVGGFPSFLLMVGTTLSFLYMKKDILGLIDKALGSNLANQSLIGALKNPMRTISSFNSGSYISNLIQKTSEGIKGGASGALAGALSGESIIRSAKEASDYSVRMVGSSQRRRGFGNFETAIKGFKAGESASVDYLNDSVKDEQAIRSLLSKKRRKLEELKEERAERSGNSFSSRKRLEKLNKEISKIEGSISLLEGNLSMEGGFKGGEFLDRKDRKSIIKPKIKTPTGEDTDSEPEIDRVRFREGKEEPMSDKGLTSNEVKTNEKQVSANVSDISGNDFKSSYNPKSRPVISEQNSEHPQKVDNTKGIADKRKKSAYEILEETAVSGHLISREMEQNIREFISLNGTMADRGSSIKTETSLEKNSIELADMISKRTRVVFDRKGQKRSIENINRERKLEQETSKKRAEIENAEEGENV